MHTTVSYFQLLNRNRLNVESHLHSLVEDAAADLHHLQVLLLLVTGALYVSHPAALILLAGIDEVAHRAVLIEHLSANDSKETRFRGRHNSVINTNHMGCTLSHIHKLTRLNK